MFRYEERLWLLVSQCGGHAAVSHNTQIDNWGAESLVMKGPYLSMGLPTPLTARAFLRSLSPSVVPHTGVNKLSHSHGIIFFIDYATHSLYSTQNPVSNIAYQFLLNAEL
jgi:hypothetical protein